MKPRRKRVATIHLPSLFLTLVATFLAVQHSNGQDWTAGSYFKRQVGEDAQQLVQLFNDFGKAQRVKVLVAEDVEGAIKTQYPEMSPEKYLDSLCQDNGLIWIYTNNAIQISRNSSLTSKVIGASSADVDRLINSLRQLGVYSDRFPIVSDREFGIIYIRGPKKYVDEVAKISADINTTLRNKANVDVKMEVFPLQHAWADDQVFQIGQKELSVPGVASILRNLLSQNASQLGITTTRLPFNRGGLRGRGLISPYNQIIQNAERAAMQSQIAAAQAQANFNATSNAQAKIQSALSKDSANATVQEEQRLAAQISTIVQADPRTNSIIIKDVQSRIETYRNLIAQLDRPVGLVQIKASIIDVDANESFQLGMPGQVVWDNNGQSRSVTARLGTDTVPALRLPSPGNLTVRLAFDQVDQLLANLQMLEADGHARLSAKPAVVTLDNTKALLEETEEFFVRIAGLEQVDLFNVNIGTKLEIMPHIIEQDGQRQIKLNLALEDGSRSATQSVDDIPIVARNKINTQAVLAEGQSLLIGGLMRETETKTVRGIPVLKRIPKIGFLFRETIHEKSRVERMVLLTPTIVELPRVQPCSDCEEITDPGFSQAAPRKLNNSLGHNVRPTAFENRKTNSTRLAAYHEQSREPIEEFRQHERASIDERLKRIRRKESKFVPLPR